MKKYLFLVIASLSTSLCLADAPEEATAAPQVQNEQPSFLNMKSEDWKACGLEKLAKEELSSLQNWIQKYSDNQKTPSKEAVTPAVTIQSIKEGGKSIELADGRVFTFSSTARKTAVLWNVGDAIRVEAAKKKKTFNLTHVATGKTIKAKLFVNETETDSK